MFKTTKVGKCIQCGTNTKIKLNNGVYACKECLDEVGFQQKEIKDTLKDVFQDDYEDVLQTICCVLEIMKRNGCSKTEHCIKSLTALILEENIDNGKISPILAKEIEKNLDLFL